jgi:hypothetical protein
VFNLCACGMTTAGRIKVLLPAHLRASPLRVAILCFQFTPRLASGGIASVGVVAPTNHDSEWLYINASVYQDDLTTNLLVLVLAEGCPRCYIRQPSAETELQPFVVRGQVSLCEVLVCTWVV